MKLPYAAIDIAARIIAEEDNRRELKFPCGACQEISFTAREAADHQWLRHGVSITAYDLYWVTAEKDLAPA